MAINKSLQRDFDDAIYNVKHANRLLDCDANLTFKQGDERVSAVVNAYNKRKALDAIQVAIKLLQASERHLIQTQAVQSA